uniref:Uncharacterized protein n=1 Tax=Romanomermis culicivorax TaxID=13658 RepID=A0A915HYI2_ROMCU
MPMPADSMASSYPCYVQLAFPKGMMFVFETFTTTPEDWTSLFSLVDGEHTIAVSFDGADDWVGIYTLLGTQFWTNRQKKNKDPIVKAIHFDAYPVYNAPAPFPHNSLDAAEIDHLTETIITAFHNVALSEVLPANFAHRVYPTISQIALTGIMRGTVLNGFRSIKVLMRTTHPKLLTAPKVPKKKKKKQKDEWNKSQDISHDEDPALQPRSMFDDVKCLQAAVASTIKSGLKDRLIELLNFSVSPMYKLAIRDRLQYETDPALPPIPHEVDDVWMATGSDASQLSCHWPHFSLHRVPPPNKLMLTICCLATLKTSIQQRIRPSTTVCGTAPMATPDPDSLSRPSQATLEPTSATGPPCD